MVTTLLVLLSLLFGNVGEVPTAPNRVQIDGFDPYSGPSADPHDPEVSNCSNWGC